MASDDTKDTGPRDGLDHQLAQAARAARLPRNLPAAQPGEPSDDLLLRVLAGAATPEERRVVDAGSAYTRERMDVLREALAETGHAPGVSERIARYVFVMAKDALDLLRAATEPLAVPAPLAVRSGAAAAAAGSFYEFVQPFDGGEAHLKVEHVPRASSPAAIDVQVKLTGAAAGTRVSLLRAGQPVDSVPVGADGVATFSGLGQDRYQIVVRKAGQEQPVSQLHLDFLPA